VRDSEVAVLDGSNDAVVRCIEVRARALQGWRPRLRVERLKIQRYGPGGHYAHHFDWHGGRGADRLSSFLVYADANCTGGGTEFPRLELFGGDGRRGRGDATAKRPGGRWCEFVLCDEEGNVSGDGVTFRPIRGNAIYWENLRPDGEGYQETWHAGLPVLTGTKVGLNIWSWYLF
jgi:prolyl 4-hydroxylase